jgi:hypothetical protein
MIYTFQRSSMVEHPAVNRRVASSSLAAGVSYEAFGKTEASFLLII